GGAGGAQVEAEAGAGEDAPGADCRSGQGHRAAPRTPAEAFAGGRPVPRLVGLGVRTVRGSASRDEQLEAGGIEAESMGGAGRLLVGEAVVS
ncbi:hypothetical protein, partial [Streptomyces sp. XY152]|uniref:hypothetical protein n=1 Tax=Streptomyces sp. XY152 TaxID=1415560 RepID=UPI000B23CE90